MNKETLIGIEIHTQLLTKTKLFCGCNTNWQNKEPNTLTCPVCLSLPGSKPVLNKRAVEYGIKIALALNCKLPKEMSFSRKVYQYPDLPNGYQRTQYEIPLAKDGFIELEDRKIRIRRINLEEDPGRLVHVGGNIANAQYTLVDYNRAGVPLCEIVTEPDFNNANEVRIFLQKLSTELEYLKVFDSKLDGTLRVDANISRGYERVELKNITSFKDVESALNFEIERQEKEKPKERETRAWVPEKGITVLLRKKETEEDYGFIIDTDLVPIELNEGLINKIREEIPELAHEKVKRYIREFKLEKKDAEVLSQEHLLANLFEKVAKEINPILAARWLRRELIRVLNYNKKSLRDLEIDERHLIDLLKLVERKEITDENAKRILEKLIVKPFDVNEYVKKEGLKVINKSEDLEEICKKAIKENLKAVEDYKKGEEKALQFIIGSIMRLSKGQADAKKVNEILKKLIKM